MRVAGKTFVVTGAGSGIGRALSGNLAAKGATVVGCDIDQVAAEATIGDLQDPNKKHLALHLDVADEASWTKVVDSVASAVGPVDGLINNAGVIGRIAPSEEFTLAEHRWLLDIDLWGVIIGTQAFLPQLRQRPEAALVNVSSVAGLLGSAGNPAYSAAKFGVRGFSQALRSELHTSSVTVTTVFPGLVRTNLAGSHPGYTEEERAAAVTRYNRLPGVFPDEAARRIVSGIERGRSHVLVGRDAWLTEVLARFMAHGPGRLTSAVLLRALNSQRPEGASRFK